MDDFLAAVGVQAMRYAIRSGIALTSTYAIGQCSRLLKTVDDRDLGSELRSLQRLLDGKIKVISPAIDLIEFKSGRGNVFLESALPLAKSLHQRIIALGHEIEEVVVSEENGEDQSGKSTSKLDRIQQVVKDLKKLLEEIDREVPLLQLAISASGESLSTSLPPGISPSRLLQASTLLIVGDTQFAQDPERIVQIGPSFTLSLYMLFLGHAAAPSGLKNEASGSSTPPHKNSKHLPAKKKKSSKSVYGLGPNDRKPLWQEVMHKARVRLCRSPKDVINATSPNLSMPASGWAGDYSYHLEVVEDLDDGRVHEEKTKREPYEGVLNAGLREFIPISQLAKIFYTDTGRMLNIGEEDKGNNPVLLLKRDINAPSSTSIENRFKGHVPEAIDYKVGSDSESEDDQADIDRQLLGEESPKKIDTVVKSEIPAKPGHGFPKHLDPEWMAFEVFAEDESDYEPSETEDEYDLDDEPQIRSPSGRLRSPGKRKSLDSGLISQIRNISLRTPMASAPQTPKRKNGRQSPTDVALSSTTEMQEFVSRSPFGAITTSLSLIEMLIRLAGLQEFQQTSHLSIPDHILSFFLEETSTTGLTGEAMWKTRSEAKKRMGFDPYTDSPRK